MNNGGLGMFYGNWGVLALGTVECSTVWCVRGERCDTNRYFSAISVTVYVLLLDISEAETKRWRANKGVSVLWGADHFQTRGVKLELNAGRTDNSENYGEPHVILNNKDGKHLQKKKNETLQYGDLTVLTKDILSLLNFKLHCISLSLCPVSLDMCCTLQSRDSKPVLLVRRPRRKPF